MVSFLYSWNPNSEGGKRLAEALRIRRVRHKNSTLKGSPKKTIINWGSSTLPEEIMKCRIINKPEAVALCSNKLTFFKKINGLVNHPEWTTDLQTAIKWVGEGSTVCARTVLQGHSAEGLVLMDKNNRNFVEAPLYTRYVPKADEYRVHIANNAVLDIQRKALRNNWQDNHPGEKPNWKVRNHDNGFVYVRQNLNVPDCVPQEALKAVATVGLDFGAVDIIYNQKQDKAYVLEINTAPGIEGTSVENYVGAFRDMGV